MGRPLVFLAGSCTLDREGTAARRGATPAPRDLSQVSDGAARAAPPLV
ncbi:hypothetical protein [Sorangium sp. So ce1000]